MKKLLPKIGISFVILFIIVLMTQKDKLMKFASSHATNDTSIIIDKTLDFSKMEDTYRGSLLEFGAGSCIQCRRMQKEIAEIREKYSDKVFIRIYNITEVNGLEKSKLFGVISIPTQILLNNEGEVIYKHFGYISSEELAQEIENIIITE